MTLITSMFDLRAPSVAVPTKLPDTKEIWTIPSKELVGIEVEAENVLEARGLNTSVWAVTEDGSLRNQGREFITRGGLEACHAPGALQSLLGNCNFCFSPRTSVHVHLNCQDLSNNQVIDIILLYCLYEKTLYRFVGKGRWKNIYCTPITDTGMLSGILQYNVKAPWEKYSGLNILPLREHGTIEFRHMHGTTDVKKLSIWIDLITRLKEYVKAHSTNEIRKLVNNFTEKDVMPMASAIWGDITNTLNISDPEEVLKNVPLIKLSMCKVSAATATASALVYTNSKYFQI